MDDFSTRNNLEKRPLQRAYISAELRTALWNLIFQLFNKGIECDIGGYDNPKWSNATYLIVKSCWIDFFGLEIDQMPNDASRCLAAILDV